MAKFATLLWSIPSLLNFIKLLNAMISMYPTQSLLMIPMGSEFKLGCLYSYPRGSFPEDVFFMKDGARIHNALTVSSKVVEDTCTDTFTYSKQKATLVDTGKYQCVLQSSGTTSEITIYIFRPPTLASVMLNEGETTLNLTCHPHDVPTNVYELSWAKNNVTVQDGTKYKTFDDKLQITNPKRADMGEYECTIIFFPNSKQDRHVIRAGVVAVNAPPAIRSLKHNMEKVKKGDDHELTCVASGYPIPTVKWFKDEVKIRRSQRIKFEEFSNIDAAKLKIYSLDYEDEGNYSCVATNEISPYNATAVMKIEVARSASVAYKASNLLILVCLLVFHPFDAIGDLC